MRDFMGDDWLKIGTLGHPKRRPYEPCANRAPRLSRRLLNSPRFPRSLDSMVVPSRRRMHASVPVNNILNLVVLIQIARDASRLVLEPRKITSDVLGDVVAAVG